MRSTLVACTPAAVLTNLALTHCAFAAAFVKLFLIARAPAMPRLLPLVALAVVPTVLILTAAPAPLTLQLRLARSLHLTATFSLRFAALYAILFTWTPGPSLKP